jgi:AcrR family transcriptional regulator
MRHEAGCAHTDWSVCSPIATKLDHRRADVKAKSTERGSSREQLLEAAAQVFARRGYRDASMNEIAAEAGFSKGALYWNFESKEELFFTLLDDVDDRLRAFMALAASAPTDRDVTAELSRGLSAVLEQHRNMVLLFHEYSAMAVRNADLAVRYAKRNALLRRDIGRAIQARFEAIDVPLSMPAEQLATVVIALVDGLSTERLTEPDAVPEDLFGQVLSLIEAGMAARSQERT